jgi:hypothetical protein
MADEEKRAVARPDPLGAQRDGHHDQYWVARARRGEDHVSSVHNNRNADRGWRCHHGRTCRSGDEDIRCKERPPLRGCRGGTPRRSR